MLHHCVENTLAKTTHFLVADVQVGLFYVIHKAGKLFRAASVGARHWTFGRLAGFEALHYDGSSNAVTRR